MAVSGVSKLGQRGQITIPKSIREALNIEAGTEVRVELVGQEILVIPEPKNPIKALRGLGKELYPERTSVGLVRELRREDQEEL